MARTQSRRTFSVSRRMFDAAKALAAEQGVTLAHLAESALIAYGVKAEPGVHMTRELAEQAMNGRRKRVLSRDEARPVRSDRVWRRA